jgi:hypothetical protein
MISSSPNSLMSGLEANGTSTTLTWLLDSVRRARMVWGRDMVGVMESGCLQARSEVSQRFRSTAEAGREC